MRDTGVRVAGQDGEASNYLLAVGGWAQDGLCPGGPSCQLLHDYRCNMAELVAAVKVPHCLVGPSRERGIHQVWDTRLWPPPG